MCRRYVANLPLELIHLGQPIRQWKANPLPIAHLQELPLPRNTETYDKWDEAYEDDYFDAPAKSKPKPKKRETNRRRCSRACQGTSLRCLNP